MRVKCEDISVIDMSFTKKQTENRENMIFLSVWNLNMQ